MVGEAWPFDSEPFDAAALMPARLHFYMKFRPASSVPGYETAGLTLPLVEVVELCPADRTFTSDGSRSSSSSTEPCEAQVLRGICQDGPGNVETWPVANLAGVKCCYGASVNGLYADGRSSSSCLPFWMTRNNTWELEEPIGNCLPKAVTYWDARRVCEVIGADLCDAETAQYCCGMSCELSADAWVRSEAADGCAELASRQWIEPTPIRRAPSGGVGGGPPRERAELFLRLSEEARGTNIRWISES